MRGNCTLHQPWREHIEHIGKGDAKGNWHVGRFIALYFCFYANFRETQGCPLSSSFPLLYFLSPSSYDIKLVSMDDKLTTSIKMETLGLRSK